MTSSVYDDLKRRGHAAAPPASPDAAVLETVRNPQADFAYLVIDYVPRELLVESKSLKLYLGAFRNHGAFHEDCTLAIARRLIGELAPLWLRIGGYWYPRGGIPIDVFFQTGAPPEGVWVPDQGVAPYRGRG